ncbi:MAG: phosphate ABC transporter permease PstA [Alphaproteobacteria bacterium]
MGITRYRWRRILNGFFLSTSVIATFMGLAVLFSILSTVITYGLPALTPALFTEMTPPPGSTGGLLNAIVGSLIITGIGIAVGAPIGVLAGTFLAEFGRGKWLTDATRFISDVLLSAPSILIGLFVFQVAVQPVHHFSAWAGALTLAIIAIPVILRTTDDMLRLVPNDLREAGAALGAPQWKIVVNISYRSVRAGIVTGILLAFARISGETAPLLFTALNNQFWSSDVNAPMANLPVVIFQFAMSPYDDWQRLAWAGALLTTAAILGLSVLARILLFSPKERPQ